MLDPRMTKLAELLITHSVRLKPGEHVLVEAFDIPDAMVIEVIRAADGTTNPRYGFSHLGEPARGQSGCPPYLNRCPPFTNCAPGRCSPLTSPCGPTGG